MPQPRAEAELLRRWQTRLNAGAFARGWADRMDTPLVAGLNFAIEVAEPDGILVEVFASSFRFAGTTRVWLTPRVLEELAAAVSDFPRGVDDQRSFDCDSGGFISIGLTCGSTGIGTVQVRIADDPQYSAAAGASLSFQVTAAAIDEFASAIRALQRTLEGEACLKGHERFSSRP